MPVDYEALGNTLSMTEIIRLQDMLSKALTRRFTKDLAMVFSDVVGSTPYFAKFGDEAGRKLQQRHFDAISQAIVKGGGRVVDTAGDGAFMVFPSMDGAVEAMTELQRLISVDNAPRPREHQLQVRIGIHFGSVLTDGHQVTGDAVNFASRVAGSGNGGEIRISKDGFGAFGNPSHRIKCKVLPPTTLKGIAKPAELMILEWRDPRLFPAAVSLETGEVLPLPDKDVISFGRLKEHDGVQANDIVLQFPGDPTKTQQISRWHFELRRGGDGFLLRPVSSGVTTVDGVAVQKGQDVLIRVGTVVRVANVMTLTFQARTVEGPGDESGATLFGS